MNNTISFESACVQEVTDNRTTRSHILPLYLTSSFAFEDINQGINIFSGKEFGHVYGRYGNPTVESVAAKLAALETHGLPVEASGMLFSSGMSAISTLLIALLQSGDKVLAQGNLYGGTTELLLKIFGPLGIETILTDLTDLDNVAKILRADEKIKLLYFETPANPTLACVDLEKLTALAKAFGKITIIDNTFATPYLQQPFQYGIDYIIHSTTKYLNGHGNSLSGAVIGTDAAMMKGKIWQTMKLAGTNGNPFDAWLLHNGLKTLCLRMEKHCSNAQVIAEFLEGHPQVKKVNYPGLESHPDHQVAKKQMRLFGGMLSFELDGGLEAGIQFMNKIKFCTLAPTLGDVDTLILHPASMSHLNVPRDVRYQNGITDGMIRLSVGIESAENIMADLAQAIGD